MSIILQILQNTRNVIKINKQNMQLNFNWTRYGLANSTMLITSLEGFRLGQT